MFNKSPKVEHFRGTCWGSSLIIDKTRKRVGFNNSQPFQLWWWKFTSWYICRKCRTYRGIYRRILCPFQSLTAKWGGLCWDINIDRAENQNIYDPQPRILAASHLVGSSLKMFSNFRTSTKSLPRLLLWNVFPEALG